MKAGGEGSVEVRSVVVGTAGHIDHGKTALVLALTGTDTDRLPEEKARGITIDLGFAALELKGPEGQRFAMSVVDVPGHHAFVRNMLAGTGGIDAVMLVIAADEGAKAQTVEHLQICRLLGMERGLVVLTKSDAASPERLQAVRGEVAALVKGTFLAGAPALAVSAMRGTGITELRAALARLAAETPPRDGDGMMRLPVDRVFTVRGFGTVVTGTLQAGRVRAGESLVLAPGGRRVRVRGVQVHGAARAEAVAPNRVALNLSGVEVAEVARGDVLVPEGTLEPVSVVDAEVEGIADVPSLRHRQRVRVHAFASESLATVLLYEGPDGTAPLVRLKLSKPMVLAPGDRFVLRQPSPARTVAGGRVLDAYPLPRLRKGATAAWLLRLQRSGSPVDALQLRLGRRGAEGMQVGDLVREMGATQEAVRRWSATLAGKGTVLLAEGAWLVDAGAAAAAGQQILQELVRAQGSGLGRAELRRKVKASEAVFALVVSRLQAARQVEAKGDLLGLPGRGTPPEREAVPAGRAAAVEQVYRKAGLASPLVREAAASLRVGPEEMRVIVTGLLRAGILVRMGSDALLTHQEALSRLVTELRATHRGRSFDVAWFKQFTGLTRKHAIPVLEYLDGARVTRNSQGVRLVL